MIWPVVMAKVCQSASSSTAFMKSSLTRTLLLEFWKKIELWAGPLKDGSYPPSISVQALRSSSTLQLMNSTMSGWSALRMTILAARRVLPPDLITPAKASKPFMKETGPDAVPPPASSSREERRGERLVPVPEPYLKSIPSVVARVRIDSIRSSSLLITQALQRRRRSMPALNQTGLLKAAFCCTSRCVSSSRKISAASGVAKYPCLFAHPWMVRTTRPINCLTLRSRSGVPITPRKYFETTTLVATCDQPVGISTSCCSKTTSPFSLMMDASRVSHWTSSNGATPGRVKYRFQERPFRLRFEALAGAVAVTLGRSVDVFWVDRAIDETSVGWE